MLVSTSLHRSQAPKDGGSEAQAATKSAAASAHLKKSDAVVGDGNPAGDGLAFVQMETASRGLLSAKAPRVTSDGPAAEACEQLMARVRAAELGSAEGALPHHDLITGDMSDHGLSQQYLFSTVYPWSDRLCGLAPLM